jgi:hypothetical protein
MYLLPIGTFVRGYGWIGKVLLVEGNAKIKLAKPVIKTKDKTIPVKTKPELLRYIRDHYGNIPIRNQLQSHNYLQIF